MLSVMADARVLAEEENLTEELTSSLLFDNAKNQFKWNDSVERFELFLFDKFRLSADEVTKSVNGKCTVWKTPSVTFNLYTKTKTLLVQGKAMDHTRDALLQTIQADINQNPAESPDETNNTHFVAEHTTGMHPEELMSPTAILDTQNVNLLAREVSEPSESENESESECFEHIQLASNSSEVPINNFGEKFFNEIAKIWSEISGIKSILASKDGFQPLQELDELRFKCTTYESTIDHLEKEKASLLEVIKILSSDDNGSRSTDFSGANKSSDCTTSDSEWIEVSNSKKKKKKSKAVDAEALNQNVPNTSAQEPRQNKSGTSHTDVNSRVSANNFKGGDVGKTKPIVLIGDSTIKHIDPKKLSQRHVHKFSYPGKTTGEIAEAVDNIAVASDPSHVIIHTGTNNLPAKSVDSCVADTNSLVLKVKNKFPNSSIGLSSIVYREDINVDAKRIEVNEKVKLIAEDSNITYIDNSVIDASALNGSRL